MGTDGGYCGKGGITKSQSCYAKARKRKQREVFHDGEAKRTGHDTYRYGCDQRHGAPCAKMGC